jgi:hypothetical protein
MTGTTDNAALDPQQIIAELQRKLDLHLRRGRAFLLRE